MITKRKKKIAKSWLLSVVLLCILGCIGTNVIAPQKQRYPQDAKRIVDITIDTQQRNELFDQLRKFADKHDFKILIDTRSSGPDNFLISMTGGDIEIDGDNVFAPGEYGFGFYHADLQHPAADSAFDDLISDLESFINKVPSATFSVKK